nr:unnamed protein product [Callosobruchus analis]
MLDIKLDISWKISLK